MKSTFQFDIFFISTLRSFNHSSNYAKLIYIWFRLIHRIHVADEYYNSKAARAPAKKPSLCRIA